MKVYHIFVMMVMRTLIFKKLKMITILARHGARHPEMSNIEEHKRGQLTNNGLRMCYLLGTYMRERYSDFFPKTFNFNENYVIASGMPRTQQSAQAFMLGLYNFGSLNNEIEVDSQFFTPESKGFNMEVDFKTPLPLGYQPVPIHSYMSEENYAFASFNPKLCPNLALI